MKFRSTCVLSRPPLARSEKALNGNDLQPKGSLMRVLIADDDAIALELLRDALAEAGHDVTCTSDGREAEQALAQSEFQVLITDWEMPHTDGIGLCRAVRAGALRGGGYVYVILLTAHNSLAERVQGLSAGADDFISKPFEPKELIARMQA